MTAWLLLRDERRDCGLALAVEEIEAIAGLPESDTDRLVVVQARFNDSTTGAAAGSIRRGGSVALRLLAHQFRNAWAAAPLRRLSVRASGTGAGAYEGESGDLLFALATFIELAGRSGLVEMPRRPFAATGTLDTNGLVGPVDGLRSKIEGVLEPPPRGLPPGSIVFYPSTGSNGDAPSLDAGLLDRARKRGVELLPVAAVEEALQALGVGVLWWHRGQPPFRALGVYQVEHHPIFFGRDDQVSSFVERLQRVADDGAPGGLVEASSGAGKSSFVQAGLLARLRLQFRPGSPPVEYAVWQPRQAGAVEGQDIGEAAAARSVLSNWMANAGINSIGFTGLDDVVEAGDFEALAATLNHTGLRGRRLVWVVDQFEEIFTLRFTESTRRAFARFLSTLQRLGVWVVAALRTEFKPRFMALADEQGRPLLVEVFERLMFPLARMPMEALEQIITEPAKVAGLAFEIGRDGVRLDAVLRDDALGADSMPLVGYALNELWLRRASPVPPGERGAPASMLTFNAYRDICGGQVRGGIKRVLGIEAERAFAGLPSLARDELPALLDALAVPVHGETREAARPAELSQWAEGSPGWQLIEALREARLLVIEAPTATASAKVRVVHEALFDGWDLARQHLEQSRDRRAQVRRLESYREHWATTASAADALLSSAADLELARVLRPTLRGPGARQLAAYIDASLAAAHQREVEKARRDVAARRRRHQVIAALASGVVALSGALIYARQQTGAAVRSQFLLLIQEAERSLERGDAASGLLIALAARDLVGDGDGRSEADPVLRKGLAEKRELAVYPGIGGRDVWIAFSPGGERMAVPKGNGIEVRDPGLDTSAVTLSTTAPPVKVVFGAGARTLAAILSNGDVKAWGDSGSGDWHPLPVPDAVDKALDVTADAKSSRITALVAGNTLFTWPADGNEPVRRVAVPVDWSTRQVTLSPEGHLLASLDGRGNLEIWEVRDASLALVQRESDVGAQARPFFANGGRQAAWVRADGAVQVWNGLAHSKPRILRGPASPSAMAFDASGSRLAGSANDGSIAVWDLRGGDATVRWLRGHEGAVTALTFLGDGSLLASASIDSSVRIWPLATEASYSTLLRGHSGAIAAMASDPRGRFIATAGVDGTARLWSARGSPLLQRLEGPATRLHHASFSPSGNEVITGGTGGAWLWHRGASGWQVVAMPMERPTPIWRTFVSGLPGVAGAASLDGEVRLWEMRRDSPPVGHSTRQPGSITSLAHNRRFTHALTASGEGNVLVWNLGHSERPEQILHHGARVGSIAIDDAAREILSIQDSGVVVHWVRDAAGVFARREVHAFSATGIQPESTVSMAGDGQVAAASFDRSVAVWRDGLRNPVTDLPSAASALWHLALSPDSTRLAAASLGGEVYVWNLSTPSRPPLRLTGHRSTTTMVAFSPDGTRLASAGLDGRVGLWDLRMLEPRPTLFDGHRGPVMSVEFAPDGNTILSASEDGAAIVWPAVAGPALAELAARSAPRCLSRSQLAGIGLDNNAEILRCDGSGNIVGLRATGNLR